MYFAFRFSKTWQITSFSPKKNTWKHSMVFYKRTLKRRESKKALDYHLHLLLGSSPLYFYWFSLFYGLLSWLDSLLRMFCFLCFMSAVSNKLFYTGDEPPFDMSSGFKPFIMKRYLGQ